MIYLDHSATSLPKHNEVIKNIQQFINSANPGRSGYGPAIEASRQVYNSRYHIAQLLKLKDERGIIFTANATASLNIAIQGLCSGIKQNILCSSMEHNAVMRPLHALANDKKINWCHIEEHNSDFYFNLKKSMSAKIDIVVLSHVSNVSGRRLDLKRISEIVKKFNSILIIDSAQSFGCEPIDMTGIDILCASAHKGLRGPMGIGIMAVQPHIKLSPLMYGGTGSSSTSLEMPVDLPDHLEVGTLNVPGIIATGNICAELSDNILKKRDFDQQNKRSFLIKGFHKLKHKITLFSPDIGGSAISIDIPDKDTALIAHDMWEKHQICVRVGLHCSPFSHQNLGTFPKGTLRISPSYDTKESDLDTLLEYLNNL